MTAEQMAMTVECGAMRRNGRQRFVLMQLKLSLESIELSATIPNERTP